MLGVFIVFDMDLVVFVLSVCWFGVVDLLLWWFGGYLLHCFGSVF